MPRPAVGPVDEEDRPRGRREQPAGQSLINDQPLLVKVGIAEQPIDALDAVLHERRAAEIAPEVGQRQFPAQEQRLDDLGDGGPAHRVDPRAAPAQPALQYPARVHAVLR